VQWVRQLVPALAAEGRTVFLSSHLMSEMSQTADLWGSRTRPRA
jgi:ABC-2 type transport system ATP-binding protein